MMILITVLLILNPKENQLLSSPSVCGLRGIIVGVITRCICGVAPIFLHVVQGIATVATEREIVIVGT